MTGSQEDTSGSLAQTNDMAGSGSREDTILTDEEFLDTIASTNLGNELDDFRVPVTAITTNDEERVCPLTSDHDSLEELRFVYL